VPLVSAVVFLVQLYGGKRRRRPGDGSQSCRHGSRVACPELTLSKSVGVARSFRELCCTVRSLTAGSVSTTRNVTASDGGPSPETMRPVETHERNSSSPVLAATRTSGCSLSPKSSHHASSSGGVLLSSRSRRIFVLGFLRTDFSFPSFREVLVLLERFAQGRFRKAALSISKFYFPFSI
jgi:hypothetical protein